MTTEHHQHDIGGDRRSYSRSEWGALSIQQRIRAMNDTLDTVETTTATTQLPPMIDNTDSITVDTRWSAYAVDSVAGGDSLAAASAPLPTVSDGRNNNGEGVLLPAATSKARSSVVDIWRKRNQHEHADPEQWPLSPQPTTMDVMLPPRSPPGGSRTTTATTNSGASLIWSATTSYGDTHRYSWGTSTTESSPVISTVLSPAPQQQSSQEEKKDDDVRIDDDKKTTVPSSPISIKPSDAIRSLWGLKSAAGNRLRSLYRRPDVSESTTTTAVVTAPLDEGMVLDQNDCFDETTTDVHQQDDKDGPLSTFVTPVTASALPPSVEKESPRRLRSPPPPPLSTTTGLSSTAANNNSKRWGKLGRPLQLEPVDLTILPPSSALHGDAASSAMSEPIIKKSLWARRGLDRATSPTILVATTTAATFNTHAASTTAAAAAAAAMPPAPRSATTQSAATPDDVAVVGVAAALPPKSPVRRSNFGSVVDIWKHRATSPPPLPEQPNAVTLVAAEAAAAPLSKSPHRQSTSLTGRPAAAEAVSLSKTLQSKPAIVPPAPKSPPRRRSVVDMWNQRATATASPVHDDADHKEVNAEEATSTVPDKAPRSPVRKTWKVAAASNSWHHQRPFAVSAASFSLLPDSVPIASASKTAPVSETSDKTNCDNRVDEKTPPVLPISRVQAARLQFDASHESAASVQKKPQPRTGKWTKPGSLPALNDAMTSNKASSVDDDDGMSIKSSLSLSPTKVKNFWMEKMRARNSQDSATHDAEDDNMSIKSSMSSSPKKMKKFWSEKMMSQDAVAALHLPVTLKEHHRGSNDVDRMALKSNGVPRRLHELSQQAVEEPKPRTMGNQKPSLHVRTAEKSTFVPAWAQGRHLKAALPDVSLSELKEEGSESQSHDVAESDDRSVVEPDTETISWHAQPAAVARKYEVTPSSVPSWAQRLSSPILSLSPAEIKVPGDGQPAAKNMPAVSEQQATTSANFSNAREPSWVTRQTKATTISPEPENIADRPVSPKNAYLASLRSTQWSKTWKVTTITPDDSCKASNDRGGLASDLTPIAAETLIQVDMSPVTINAVQKEAKVHEPPKTPPHRSSALWGATPKSPKPMERWTKPQQWHSPQRLSEAKREIGHMLNDQALGRKSTKNIYNSVRTTGRDSATLSISTDTAVLSIPKKASVTDRWLKQVQGDGNPRTGLSAKDSIKSTVGHSRPARASSRSEESALNVPRGDLRSSTPASVPEFLLQRRSWQQPPHERSRSGEKPALQGVQRALEATTFVEPRNLSIERPAKFHTKSAERCKKMVQRTLMTAAAKTKDAAYLQKGLDDNALPDPNARRGAPHDVVDVLNTSLDTAKAMRRTSSFQQHSADPWCELDGSGNTDDDAELESLTDTQEDLPSPSFTISQASAFNAWTSFDEQMIIKSDSTQTRKKDLVQMGRRHLSLKSCTTDQGKSEHEDDQLDPSELPSQSVDISSTDSFGVLAKVDGGTLQDSREDDNTPVVSHCLDASNATNSPARNTSDPAAVLKVPLPAKPERPANGPKHVKSAVLQARLLIQTDLTNVANHSVDASEGSYSPATRRRAVQRLMSRKKELLRARRTSKLRVQSASSVESYSEGFSPSSSRFETESIDSFGVPYHSPTMKTATFFREVEHASDVRRVKSEAHKVRTRTVNALSPRDTESESGYSLQSGLSSRAKRALQRRRSPPGTILSRTNERASETAPNDVHYGSKAQLQGDLVENGLQLTQHVATWANHQSTPTRSESKPNITAPNSTDKPRLSSKYTTSSRFMEDSTADRSASFVSSQIMSDSTARPSAHVSMSPNPDDTDPSAFSPRHQEDSFSSAGSSDYGTLASATSGSVSEMPADSTRNPGNVGSGGDAKLDKSKRRDIVAEEFCNKSSNHFEAFRTAVAKVGLGQIAADWAGEVALGAMNIQKLATNVEENIRKSKNEEIHIETGDSVISPVESTVASPVDSEVQSPHGWRSDESTRFDDEDIAIEVEYMDDEEDDDPATDLGMCAPIDEAIRWTASNQNSLCAADQQPLDWQKPCAALPPAGEPSCEHPRGHCETRTAYV